MKLWRWISTLCCVATLAACAGLEGPGRIPADMVEQADILSGAQVSAGPPLQVVYPASLYSAGAVLPNPEGLQHFEALAAWLKRYPETSWQFTVNAEKLDAGPDPEVLASKRQELLERFFARKGLPAKEWEWQALVGEAYQLRLVVMAASP